jgi:hypothetical protein
MKFSPKFKHINLLLAGFLLVFSFQACKLDPNEGINWDADLLTPIAYGKVALDDLVGDSTFFETGDNNEAVLVFRDTLASTSLSELVELPDTNLNFVATLDSLELAANLIEQRVSLADIARQLIATGDPIQAIIGQALLQHGDTIDLLPFSGVSFGNQAIDASEFFEFAIVESGELKLTINNQLPVDIVNLQFEVNNVGGSAIIQDTFPFISKNSTVVEYYDMSGKTIESELEASLTDMTVLAGRIVIDTTDYISISLEPVDLKVLSAKAIFPGQTVIDSVQETKYEFPGEFADIELTKIVVSNGKLRAYSKSYIEDTVEFSYSLPSADRNGEIPRSLLKLIPAVNGVPSEQTQEIDLAGFSLDMTAGGTTFNTLVQAYQVNLVYSGKLVEIEKTDSVIVDFGLFDLEPTYVEGYIGKQSFSFSGEEALNLFNFIDLDKLAFSSPRANLTFANSIGIDNQIQIKEMKATNTETGESVSLIGEVNRTNTPLVINGPNLPDTNEVVLTQIQFDAESGNLDDFINVLPDQLSYDFEILGNYNGQPGVHDNFASNKSEIAAYVEFELPLEGIIKNFRFADTTETEFELGSTEDIDRVNDGFFRIIMENRYPMEGVVTAILHDEAMNEIQVIAKDIRLEAGEMNATGYVANPTVTTVEIPFDREELVEILEESRFVTYKFRLSTKPDGEPVRLYSDYEISTKIVGQFNFSL